MGAGFKIHFQHSYTRITLPNDYEVSPGNLVDLWKSVFNIAKKTSLYRVLIGVDNLRLHKTAKSVPKAPREKLPIKVACCINPSVPQKLNHLFMRSALRCCTHAAVFSDTESAVQWLQEQQRGDGTE